MLQIKQKAILGGHNASVYSISPFSENTNFLSASGDGWIVEWDLKNPDLGQLLATIEGNIFSILYLPEKDWIVAGDMYGGLHWIDVKAKANFRSTQLHQKGLYGLLSIENILYTVGGDGSIARWNIDQAKSIDSLQLSAKSLRCLAYQAKLSDLAVAGTAGHIYILDPKTLAIKQQLTEAHQNSVFCLKYSPDGRYLLSGGRDAYLLIWDIAAGYMELPTQAAHLATVNAIAFHPQLPLFATAGRDKTIKIWDSNSFALLKVIDTVRYGGHLNSVNDLWWSDFEGLLVSCSDDRTLMLWEIS